MMKNTDPVYPVKSCLKQDLVFLYPGQGSQHVGMGFDLYRTYQVAREFFTEAERILGFSLGRICFEGPEQRLNSDLTAQLAVYTVSCITTNVLMGKGILPSVVTGYSSGFYAAAYAAGCFTFSDGLLLVKKAGELLLEEGTKVEGQMAVIFGLSSDKIEALCKEVGHVDIAIRNTSRQIIISGSKARVEEVVARAMDQGALDAYALPAIAPYHSRFMEKSAKRLLDAIKGFPIESPKIPLLSYLTLEPVPDKETLKGLITSQLSRTVFWEDLISKILIDKKPLFIEAGPGKVLTRTLKWINRGSEIMNASDKAGLSKIEERCSST